MQNRAFSRDLMCSLCAVQLQIHWSTGDEGERLDHCSDISRDVKDRQTDRIHNVYDRQEHESCQTVTHTDIVD